MSLPVKIILLVSLLLSSSTELVWAAESYVPSSEQEIVERLPVGFSARLQQAITKQHWAEQTSAQSSAQSTVQSSSELSELVREQLEISRKTGDPRYTSQALTLLERQAERGELSTELLLLEAVGKQYLHDFYGALADLEKIARQHSTPDRIPAQTYLTKASILTILGQTDEARSACRSLISRVSSLTLAACLSGPALLGSALPQHYKIMTTLLETNKNSASADELVWVYGLLGEMAERLGIPEEARVAYQNGLALKPQNIFLRTSLADLMLSTGHAADAWQLLSGAQAADVESLDGLLLRRARAAKILGFEQEFARYRDSLRERAQQAIDRAEFTHARELAMTYLLEPVNQTLAHQLALRNWQLSKERVDTRLLLTTSNLTGDINAAHMVNTWLSQKGAIDNAPIN